ncbi:MAG: hypothetical protein IPM84_19775 [Anaerolineae bacterium]|nr:hypothetical protein [Anaerolineae bacterium]
MAGAGLIGRSGSENDSRHGADVKNVSTPGRRDAKARYDLPSVLIRDLGGHAFSQNRSGPDIRCFFLRETGVILAMRRLAAG